MLGAALSPAQVLTGMDAMLLLPLVDRQGPNGLAVLY